MNFTLLRSWRQAKADKATDALQAMAGNTVAIIRGAMSEGAAES